MWLLSVTHAIHYTTSLHCLVCPCCTSHTTVPVLHVTCYVYVHMHHANVCSVLHMLTVCLDHALSLHTCTVLVYLHVHVYIQHTMSVCGPACAIVRLLSQNKKWLLGASVSHVHSEALLHAMSAVSIVTVHRGSISRSEVETGSEDECY